MNKICHPEPVEKFVKLFLKRFDKLNVTRSKDKSIMIQPLRLSKGTDF